MKKLIRIGPTLIHKSRVYTFHFHFIDHEDEDSNSRDETIRKYLLWKHRTDKKEEEDSVYGIGITELKFQLPGKFMYHSTWLVAALVIVVFFFVFQSLLALPDPFLL